MCYLGGFRNQHRPGLLQHGLTRNQCATSEVSGISTAQACYSMVLREINVLPRRFQESAPPRPATAWSYETSMCYLGGFRNQHRPGLLQHGLTRHQCATSEVSGIST